MRHPNGSRKNTEQPLKLTLVGFFISLVGWLIGMIGRGDSNSVYVLLGSVIVPFGVAVFLVGFFWLLVVYLEHWERK
jgi:hypothetical protein